MKPETVITVDELPQDVVDAIKKGQKIEAIRLLRIASGLGLANAKVLVDAGARRHGVVTVHPAISKEGGSSIGLLKGLILLLLLFAAYQYFIT